MRMRPVRRFGLHQASCLVALAEAAGGLDQGPRSGNQPGEWFSAEPTPAVGDDQWPSRWPIGQESDTILVGSDRNDRPRPKAAHHRLPWPAHLEKFCRAQHHG